MPHQPYWKSLKSRWSGSFHNDNDDDDDDDVDNDDDADSADAADAVVVVVEPQWQFPQRVFLTFFLLI